MELCARNTDLNSRLNVTCKWGYTHRNVIKKLHAQLNVALTISHILFPQVYKFTEYMLYRGQIFWRDRTEFTIIIV